MSYDDDRELVEQRCGTEWNNRITWSTVSKWLSQFDEDHRPYAIKMMKHFQFYNYGSVLQLLAIGHHTLLRDLLIGHHFDAGQGTPEERTALFREELKHTLFVPVSVPEEPKSGDQVAYMYKQACNPDKVHFTSIEHLKERLSNDIRYLVLVDDFLGTGIQAYQYFSWYVQPIVQAFPNLKLFWLVGVAMSEGIDHVEMSTPLEVVAALTLQEDAKAFSPSSRVFDSLDIPTARNIMMSYGERLNPMPKESLGFGNSQLLLGFDWCPPDNTVTLIWWPEDPNWVPVFPRPRKGGN